MTLRAISAGASLGKGKTELTLISPNTQLSSPLASSGPTKN
jgi:hypothetical protein